MQAPNLRTPSLLGFTATQATLLVTLRSHSKVLDTINNDLNAATMFYQNT